MRLVAVTGQSPNYFQPHVRAKFDLDEYDVSKHRRDPLLVYGCGSDILKRTVMGHMGFCVIVWTGSDTLKFHRSQRFIEYCKKNSSRIFHITFSHWCRVDLAHWGLEHIHRLVIATDMTKYKFEPSTKGGVYHYGNVQRPWYYGTPQVQSIEENWEGDDKPEFQYASFYEYTKDELYQVYMDSLVGVRLTEHDGVAGSVIEMGLMGRRTIYNGDHPCAIPYSPNYYKKYTPEVALRRVFQNEDITNKVTEILHNQLQYNPLPDKQLAEEMLEFIYDDLKWLDTKFYTG